jgi:hypothetical protein
MTIFRDFERKLESIFEGVLLRAFKSGVHPVELGKKLTRELEGNKTIGVSRIYVPNRYEVGLSPRDYERFATYQSVLATELENLLISYVKEKGYSVLDRPQVRFKLEEKLHEGEFWIRSRMEGEIPGKEKERKGIGKGEGDRIPLLQVLGKGDDAVEFALGDKPCVIGRNPACEIVLPDPNVSRMHARIEKKGGEYHIVDLDSTNGTFVNEKRINQSKLQENDIIRVGTTKLIFRRS